VTANDFAGAYRNRRVLVTGHTGFKGSWLSLWLRELGAEVRGLALAPDTEPSHHKLLGAPDEAPVDLRDADAVKERLRSAAPEIIFHLGAQSLVRRSYRDPIETVAVNVLGLAHLFEAARATPSVRALVNITTDKCYENDGRRQGYREEDPLGGYDPYSASKACSEILSSSWRRSFLTSGERNPPLLLATARAGNVLGGGDWAPDRLVPDLMRCAANRATTPIRYPESTRPWQHVLEPLSGYLELGRRLLAGETAIASAWNFGPPAEGVLPVRELAGMMAARWPAIQLELDKEMHPHEAHALALDWSRARNTLGWRPVWGAARMVERTVDWYRAWTEGQVVRTLDDLSAYRDDARRAGLSWAGA